MKKFFFIPLIAIIFFGCGGKSDSEYFENAKKLIDEGSISDAVTELETMLNEYPESDLSTQALFQLGSLYQNKLVKNLEPIASSKKAIEYYEKIYQKYGESEEAPKSLFMIGFIQANELFDLEAAKNNYKLFLEKYPNSELTVSAKMELEMLGKSPEEILLQNKNNQ